MRAHRKAAILAATLWLIAPAATPAQPAEDRGGVRTETQERMASKFDSDLLWNLIGAFGLLGLLGLRRGHAEDSYHPAAFE